MPLKQINTGAAVRADTTANAKKSTVTSNPVTEDSVTEEPVTEPVVSVKSNAEKNTNVSSTATTAATDTAASATTTEEESATTSTLPNYSATMQSLYEKIMNRGSFSYDPNTDDTYNAYKKLYESQGKQAMQDTIGQAAALTGGYGNTYAQTAGQQAYNSYLEKLNSLIPELREEAYNEWANEGDTLTTQYSLAQDNQEAAYEKYMNMIQNLGYMPTEDELAAAGMTAEEAQLWYNKYNNKSSGGTSASQLAAQRAQYSVSNSTDRNGDIIVNNSNGRQVGSVAASNVANSISGGYLKAVYDDKNKTVTYVAVK